MNYLSLDCGNHIVIEPRSDRVQRAGFWKAEGTFEADTSRWSLCIGNL